MLSAHYSCGQAEEISKDLEFTSNTLGFFFFFNLTLAVRGGNFGIPSVSNISLEPPVRGGKYRSISGSRLTVGKALLRCSGFVVKVS